MRTLCTQKLCGHKPPKFGNLDITFVRIDPGPGQTSAQITCAGTLLWALQPELAFLDNHNGGSHSRVGTPAKGPEDTRKADGVNMLTSTDPVCVKVFSDSLTNYRLVVGLGQYFGKDWIHLIVDESTILSHRSRQDYTNRKYNEMDAQAPKHAQHMHNTRSGVDQICIMQTRIPQITSILQISSVMWKSSRMRGVKFEVFHDPGFGDVPGEWTAFDVDVGSSFARLIGTDITTYVGNK